MRKAKKVSNFLFSVVMLLICIAIGMSLYRVASAESTRKINVDRDDPIWGNERDFVRLFKVEEGDFKLHVSSLKSDKFNFTDEGIYSFVVKCHNASGEELHDVKLSLSYPDRVAYSSPDIATATIEWCDANGKTGTIVSDIVIESVEDMATSARDVYIVVNDESGNVVSFQKRDVSIVNGIVTQEIYLGTVPASEAGNYTVFVAGDVRSVI